MFNMTRDVSKQVSKWTLNSVFGRRLDEEGKMIIMADEREPACSDSVTTESSLICWIR